MYICGSPGLGKSLTLRQAHAVIGSTLLAPHDRLAFINAFKLDSPAAVYRTVLQALTQQPDSELEGVDARTALQALIGHTEEGQATA
eukprot:2663019-Prymnesium_polylepis.1